MVIYMLFDANPVASNDFIFEVELKFFAILCLINSVVYDEHIQLSG